MDEEIVELMEDYDLDSETAERVNDIMEEYGIDPEEAIIIEEAM